MDIKSVSYVKIGVVQVSELYGTIQANGFTCPVEYHPQFLRNILSHKSLRKTFPELDIIRDMTLDLQVKYPDDWEYKLDEIKEYKVDTGDVVITPWYSEGSWNYYQISDTCIRLTWIGSKVRHQVYIDAIKSGDRYIANLICQDRSYEIGYFDASELEKYEVEKYHLNLI